MDCLWNITKVGEIMSITASKLLASSVCVVTLLFLVIRVLYAEDYYYVEGPFYAYIKESKFFGLLDGLYEKSKLFRIIAYKDTFGNYSPMPKQFNKVDGYSRRGDGQYSCRIRNRGTIFLGEDKDYNQYELNPNEILFLCDKY